MIQDVPRGVLSIAELRHAAASGEIDEVLVAAPDLQGRLQGSGLSPEFFLDDVVGGSFGACVYLYSVDVEMATGPGYAVDAAERGYGDVHLVPDLTTLRRAPWHPASAVVLADTQWADGTPVRVAPRSVLRAQLDRLAALGLRALAGTELEFVVFEEDLGAARRAGYGGLTPATPYNVDFALAGTTGMDGLVRRLRRAMATAGVPVESARAEVHPGQYEIVFRYDEAMRTCDNHVLYKTAAKNLAAEAGQALTFMAKYDQGEGNSCHVHLSLRGDDSTNGSTDGSADGGADGGTNAGTDGGRDGGTPVFAAGSNPVLDAADPGRGGADVAGMSGLMQAFLAGQLACLAEFTLLFAPNVNSYKRLAPGAFAPTAVAWGRDNRTCPLRVVGAGSGLRFEHRVPGGDANPYLAVAAMVAAGLHGVEAGLDLPPAVSGNAFADPGLVPLPRTLREAVDAWRASTVARDAFGDDVVDHLANAGEVELAAYQTTVTDWERRRGFERL